jgi:hypothetical protein
MKQCVRGVLLAAIGLMLAGPVFAQAKQVVFSEILIKRSGGNADQIVELRNTGASSINIGGWIFCHEFDYSSVFPGGTTIAAGAFLRVHFNASGTNSATDIYFSGDVLSETSDLGLYTNANFGSPAAMHAFVQFGGVPTGGGRQSVAAGAGLWTNNAFVTLPATESSVELCGVDPTQVGNWTPTATPTLGATNGCGVAAMPTSWSAVKSIFR